MAGSLCPGKLQCSALHTHGARHFIGSLKMQCSGSLLHYFGALFFFQTCLDRDVVSRSIKYRTGCTPHHSHSVSSLYREITGGHDGAIAQAYPAGAYNSFNSLATQAHHGSPGVLGAKLKRTLATLIPLQIDTQQLRFAPQRPEGTSRVPGGIHDCIGGNKLAGIQVHHRG